MRCTNWKSQIANKLTAYANKRYQWEMCMQKNTPRTPEIWDSFQVWHFFAQGLEQASIKQTTNTQIVHYVEMCSEWNWRSPLEGLHFILEFHRHNRVGSIEPVFMELHCVKLSICAKIGLIMVPELRETLIFWVTPIPYNRTKKLTAFWYGENALVYRSLQHLVDTNMQIDRTGALK